MRSILALFKRRRVSALSRATRATVHAEINGILADLDRVRSQIADAPTDDRLARDLALSWVFAVAVPRLKAARAVVAPAGKPSPVSLALAQSVARVR